MQICKSGNSTGGSAYPLFIPLASLVSRPLHKGGTFSWERGMIISRPFGFIRSRGMYKHRWSNLASQLPVCRLQTRFLHPSQQELRASQWHQQPMAMQRLLGDLVKKMFISRSRLVRVSFNALNTCQRDVILWRFWNSRLSTGLVLGP